MIVKNKGLDKICCFFVSEFHLEMILVPYLNKLIDENRKITILTEINLTESLRILMSKINLNEKRKEEILNLNWQNRDEKNLSNESVIIIIGSNNFIKNTNESLNVEFATIVDCYNFNEVESNSREIAEEYEKNLNTKGIEDI